MIPYALGLGALLGSLSQIWPWAVLGLLVGLRFPNQLRWAAWTACALVMGRTAVPPTPALPPEGTVVRWAGQVRQGFLRGPSGVVYLQHFPVLPDGTYQISGRITAPQRQRNPGGFDQAAWLSGLGVKRVLKVEEAYLLSLPPQAYRDRFRNNLQAELSPQVAALAIALSLGEKQGLNSLEEAFQQAGLSHALALSGLNVGILVGLALVLLWPLGPPRYWLALPVAWVYIWLAGSSPSLLRASLMGSIVLLVLALGRGRAPILAGLALSFTIHLLWQPMALFTLSFQLSYLAVLGMALILPRIQLPSGWRGYLLGVLAVTVAAQMFLLPLLLHHFHQIPLLSPLANLLVMPILNALVPLTFLKGLSGTAIPLLTQLVEALAQAAIWLTQSLAQGPYLAWGQISATGFALYYLALIPLLIALYQLISWRSALLLSACAVMGSLIPTWFERSEVWQLDVGQGDASLIRLADGSSILVDGGRGWAAGRVVEAVKALGLRKIDLIVATHPDADHIEAIPEIMSSIPVGTLLTGPAAEKDAQDLSLRRAARREKIRIVEVGTGNVLRLGPASLRFLGPHGGEPEDNERSVVFELSWAGRRALFTGDASSSTEASWKLRPVHLLKVGHHGSRHSTGSSLLQITRPVLAVIGVGTNRYGHPSPEVLERLAVAGSTVYRTDLTGAVRIQLW